MIGLIAFGSIALWLAVSGWIAWRVSKLVKPRWVKVLLFLTLTPLLVFAPLADEIIGKYQFERYCKNAKEVKIYATIPVGEELYTPEGKWRLEGASTASHEEFVRLNKLNELVQSLVRWDHGPLFPKELSTAIPIQEYETRLFDAKTGRILAEFRSYSNRGGWLKQNFGVGSASGGFLLPQGCAPELVRQSRLTQKLLPFDGAKGRDK